MNSTISNCVGWSCRRGYDAQGFSNFDRDPGTVSPWRGNAYANYNNAGLNVRYVFKYVDGVTDDRCRPEPAPCAVTPEFGPTDFGREIGSFTQHDVHLLYELPVSFAEPGTAGFGRKYRRHRSARRAAGGRLRPLHRENPLGRTYRVGLKANF